MKTIIEQAKILKDKQTWIEKGLQEIFTKFNDSLTDLKSPEMRLRFAAFEYESDDQQKKIIIELNLEYAEALRLVLAKKDYYSSLWVYTKISIEDRSISDLKKIIEKLPDAFIFFEQGLRNENLDILNQENTLNSILKRLNG